MKTFRIMSALLPLLLSATAAVAGAQGKGQGKGADHGNQGKGKDRVAKEVRKDVKEARTISAGLAKLRQGSRQGHQGLREGQGSRPRRHRVRWQRRFSRIRHQ